MPSKNDNRLLRKLQIISCVYFLPHIQWRNDGVAATSGDGGPTGKGPLTVPEFLMFNFNVGVCRY